MRIKELFLLSIYSIAHFFAQVNSKNNLNLNKKQKSVHYYSHFLQ